MKEGEGGKESRNEQSSNTAGRVPRYRVPLKQLVWEHFKEFMVGKGQGLNWSDQMNSFQVSQSHLQL